MLNYTEIRVYRRRWVILLVVSLLNASNAMIWISPAAVADKTAQFYGVMETTVDWFSLAFLVVSLPVGILAMWLLDQKLSILSAIFTGAFFNMLGALLRVLSTLPFFHPGVHGFWIALLGQIFAACGQPFIFFLPTEVAELWFPDHQRTLATTVASMGQPLGILIANAIGPLLAPNVGRMLVFNCVWLAPALLALVLTVWGVRSSRPPHPPSVSACYSYKLPFLQGLKQVLTNRAYLLLMLYMGCSVGAFSTMLSLMEQTLCTWGYSNVKSGIFCAVMISCGFVGAALASFITDKKKNFIDIMKGSVAMTCLAFCCFQAIFRYSGIDWALGLNTAIIGLFGFATYPVGLELAVECTYPTISEFTSAGLVLLSSQIQGFLLLLILPQLARTLDSSTAAKSICGHSDGLTKEVIQVQDMTVPLMTLTAFIVFCGVIFIAFFSTEYNRLKMELSAIAANVLKPNIPEGSSSTPIDDSYSNS